MSRWWRAYDDALDDEKLNFLSDRSFRGWFNIMCLASKNAGILPPLKNISFRLRLTEQQTSRLLDELCAAGLLDPIEVPDAPMSYEPHNWKERQFQSDVSTERVKRFRNGKRNVSITDNATPPETETETETEQRRKKETRASALSPEWRLWFDTFWQAWPNKVGKPAALKALAAAAKRGADLDAIIAGVQRYVRDKPPDRPWLNPATFLNQNRWEDQPAQVQNGKDNSISAACDNLVNLVNSGFGRASSEDGVCGGEDEANARLLSFRGS